MKKRITLLVCFALILSVFSTALTSCQLGKDRPGSLKELLSPVRILYFTRDIYYTVPDQNADVEMVLKNKNGFAIESITVNGIKVQKDFFEVTQSYENTTVKLPILQEPGIREFSVDSIEYRKGSQIKSVDCKNWKFRIGSYVEDMVTATVTSKKIDVVNHNCASFKFEINDPYSIVEAVDGYFYATLLYYEPIATDPSDNVIIINPDSVISTDHMGVVTISPTYTQLATTTLHSIQDLTLGENEISLSDLKPGVEYKLSIIGIYDDLTENEGSDAFLSSGALFYDSSENAYKNARPHTIYSISFTTNGDFYFTDNKPETISSAISESLLDSIDSFEKKYSGTPEKYDVLGYCYYATDPMGNVFYANKTDDTRYNLVTLGVSGLSSFDKAISDAVLSAENLGDSFYQTTAQQTVGKDDVIAISYEKTWIDDGFSRIEKATREYFTVNPYSSALFEFLIGKRIGENLGDITITESTDWEETRECTYKNVTVDYIIRDKSQDVVADGDKVYVTYTLTFDAMPFYNEETHSYDLPYPYTPVYIDPEGRYKQTFTYEVVTAKADDMDENGYFCNENRTFEGQLVGKPVGSTTSSITVQNVQIGDHTVDVKYTYVKINNIIKSDVSPITFKYTPYPEELNYDNSNKKTEVNTKGEKVILNGVELTYYILPVYYVDIPEISGEIILGEFYDTVSYNDDGTYLLSILNDTDYSYNGKSITELVNEYVTLYDKYESIKDSPKSAESALKNAQSNYANYVWSDNRSESDREASKNKMEKAHEEFLNKKAVVDAARDALDKKIDEILSCTKNGEPIEDELINNLKSYVQYLLNSK